MTSSKVRLWVLQPRGRYYLVPKPANRRKLPDDLIATVALTPNAKKRTVKIEIRDLCDYTGSKWRAVQRETAKIERLVVRHTHRMFPGHKLTSPPRKPRE